MTIPGEGVIGVTGYHWRSPKATVYPGGTVITTAHDGLMRPGEYLLADADGNLLASQVFSYDQENHIVGIATHEGGHTYTLDELYRLTLAAHAYNDTQVSESFSYDGVGNRKTEDGGDDWQYGAANQLLSRPGATYSYDANGHTETVTEGTSVTSYRYNLSERLDQVTTDGVVVGQYDYDPFGKRVKKTTAGGTVYFHYDETGLLAEYDGAGNLISEYHYRPGSAYMSNPLFKRDGGVGGGVHYYRNSHLGAPIEMFDRSGRVTWRGRSGAFGETTAVVAITDNPLRFPGQYEDGETGLFYNFHRYYESGTGRYAASDPIGLSGGGNPYRYAESNPVYGADPYGLRGFSPRYGNQRAQTPFRTLSDRAITEGRKQYRETPDRMARADKIFQNMPEISPSFLHLPAKLDFRNVYRMEDGRGLGTYCSRMKCPLQNDPAENFQCLSDEAKGDPSFRPPVNLDLCICAERTPFAY